MSTSYFESDIARIARATCVRAWAFLVVMLAFLLLPANAHAIAPVGSLTSVPGNNQVQLTWINPGTGDHDHTNIYRATSATGALTLIGTVAVGVTSYTDLTAANGTDYWYTVRASTIGGLEAPVIATGGLRGDYYSDTTWTTLRGTETDPQVNFNWGAGGPDILGGQVNNFSDRWTGYVRADFAETYTFYLNKDDTGKVIVDGITLFSNSCVCESSGAIALSVGWHTVQIDHSEAAGSALAIASFSSASQPKVVIPTTNLGQEMRIQTAPRNATVTVTAPNGAEVLNGSEYTVTWNGAGVVDHWDIAYSLDSGVTYNGAVNSGVPGASISYVWSLPVNVNSGTARIRVRAMTASNVVMVSDASDADFELRTPPPLAVSNLVATPANGQVALTWTNPVDARFNHVDILRSSLDGDVGTVVFTTADNTIATWTDLSVINGTTYYYRVRSVDNLGQSGPSITAGELNASYYSGDFAQLLFRQTDSPANLTRYFGNTMGPASPEQPDGQLGDWWTGRYNGYVYAPTTASYIMRTDYKGGVRLYLDGVLIQNDWRADACGCATQTTNTLSAGWHAIRLDYYENWADNYVYLRMGRGSYSDILSPSFGRETVATATPSNATTVVVSPNGGQTWRTSTKQVLSWTSTGSNATAVNLYYSSDGGATYPYLIARAQPATGTYTWVVPLSLNTAQARIKAVALNGGWQTLASDESDANFTIDTSTTPPPAVQSISSVASTGQVAVSWVMPSPLSGTDHVDVYRASIVGAEPTLVYTSPNATTVTWNDTTVTNGTTYYYYVRTATVAGLEGISIQAGKIHSEYFSGDFANYLFSDEESPANLTRYFGNSNGPASPKQPDGQLGDGWTGRYGFYVYAATTDTYYLRTDYKGGVRLWLDDQLVHNDWRTDACGCAAGSYTYLTQGWHRIRMEYYQNWAENYIELRMAARNTGSQNYVDIPPANFGDELNSSATPSNATTVVVAPNGGQTWNASTKQVLSWSSVGSDAALANIWLSTDDGISFPYLVARAQPATGSYTWVVPPGLNTAQARIKVQAITGGWRPIAEDTSNANFTIDTASVPPPAVQSITAAAGNGQVTVNWVMPSPLSGTDHVSVYRASILGAEPDLVYTSPNAATVSWNDVTVTNGTTYYYYVRTDTAAGLEGISIQAGKIHSEYFSGDFANYLFSDEESPANLTRYFGNGNGPGSTKQPDGQLGDWWTSRYGFSVYAPSPATYYLRTDYKGGMRLWVDNVLSQSDWRTDACGCAAGSYTYLTQGWHRIRMEYYQNWAENYIELRMAARNDGSQNYVDIIPANYGDEQVAVAVPTNASSLVTAPNGGQSWKSSSKQVISWISSGSDSALVNIWLSTDGGLTYPILVVRAQPAIGSYTWVVPPGINSTQARIKAQVTNGGWRPLAEDSSDANFTIDTSTTPPPAVQNIITTPGSNQVAVSWTMPSPLAGADHVTVYRASTLGAEPDLVYTSPDSTTVTWTDTSAVNGTTYDYYVRTVSATGVEGLSIQAGKIHAEYYNSDFGGLVWRENESPTNLTRYFGGSCGPYSSTAYPGENSMCDWFTARYGFYVFAPSATTYYLRTDYKGGMRLWVDNVLSQSDWRTDACGCSTGSYSYMTQGWHRIRMEYYENWAENYIYLRMSPRNDGSQSYANITPANFGVENYSVATPSAATVTVTSPDGGELWQTNVEHPITWSAAGAPVGATYRVSYSLNSGQSYDYMIARNLSATSLSWKVPESVASSTVMVQVEMVDPSSGQAIAVDRSNAVLSVDTTALLPVTNFTAVPGWSRIDLSWTNPGGAAFNHVNLYRSTTAWTVGAKIATISSPGTTYTDLAVANGTRYYYTARAADATDREAMILDTGGLLADYYNGTDFNTYVGRELDPTVDYNWGAGGPAILGATTDNFSVRWTGYLYSDADGEWAIDNNRPTRDGTRIWIDDQYLINRWNAGDTDSAGTAYMRLTLGWHRVTIEYHETTGNAYTALYHARSGLARRVVPSSFLATERQLSVVPIDPNPPVPNPTGQVQTDSPTQITWSMPGVTDSESGLPALPYTFDNATTWQASSSFVRTALSPNSPYTQTLKARDAYGNATTPRVLTARTLAVNPSVTTGTPTAIWLGPNSVTVTFSNLATFGAGGVEYYRYVWQTNPAHTFDGTETVWNSGNLAQNATSSGVYYLHVKSYNADNVGGGQAMLGPYWVDVTAPTPNPPTMNVASTLSSVTMQIAGSSDAQSGLAASPYSFDNGSTWQASDTLVVASLSPNTSVSKQVLVRDAIGNATTASTVTAATLPVDPDVSVAPAGGAPWYPGGTTFTMTSNVAFGPGTIWGYRYVRSINPAAPVADTDTQWTSGTTPVTINSTGVWYLRARTFNSSNTGGNTQTLGPFKVDATAPPPVVPSAPSPTAVAPVLSWTGVTDAESGMSIYRVYRSTTSGVVGSLLASVGGTTYTDGAALVDNTIYYYTVRPVDNSGNEQTVGNTQIAVTYSSNPPTGNTVTIAGGAGAIASTGVTLTLASTNSVDMMISNAPDFSGGTWEPYSATRGWTLLAGDANKSVYAKFRNGGGTVSPAVVDTIDLDTTAPTPNPPVMSANPISASQINWTVGAVTDALVGLPAAPYSFDGGGTWQAGTSYSRTALAPNTSYSVSVTARDALGNTTAPQPISAVTQAAAPSVTSSPLPDPSSQPRGTTFTFTNQATWGPGGVQQYRWVWDTSATHSFLGTEAIWSSGTLPKQELNAGTYYMHFLAYNSASVAGQTLDMGPYIVAPPSSQADLNINVAATQTLSCVKTDYSGTFLLGDQKDATVDCAASSQIAGWNLQAHANSAPFFTNFTDFPAAPQTYFAPAPTAAHVAFTASGAYSDAVFANGTKWRGWAGTTDIRIGGDTGTQAGTTITTKVRTELGTASTVPAGIQTQTMVFTLNPGP